MMPSLLLTNTNRLLNKIDDLCILCSSLSPSIVAICETWLSPDITDDAVHVHNYVIHRRDRKQRLGGGIILYVRSDLNSKHLKCYDDDFHEIIFVSLRPALMPRPFTALIICLTYCPPWYSIDLKKSLAQHIINSVDNICRTNPNTAFIICGDLNQFDTGLFNNHLLYQQFVRDATRGNNILDKVFINACKCFYSYPADILPPLGKSDHCCVFIKPKQREAIPNAGWRSVYKRSINTAAVESIGRQLAAINWSSLYLMNDVQQQTDYFYAIVNDIVDCAAPITEFRYKCNDRPWVTPYFKKIISQRNIAYRKNNLVVYKKLRNRVNHIAQNLKKDFYFRHIDNFKTSNPSKWWKNIKSICGYSVQTNSSESFNDICFNNEPIDSDKLVDTINNFFISVSQDIPRLQSSVLEEMKCNLSDVPDEFIISEYSVFNALSKLKLNKSTGPDNLPNSLLKSVAELISGPICSIINSSIRCGVVPTQWKLSKITPLPKIFPPLHVESDIRPISITSSLSKIAESFLCKYFNYYFKDHLDENQFGCTAGRSATFALIKFSHFLFNSSDDPNMFCRILFIDFMKAFELVDHNVLLRKMHNMNIPVHLSTWFLSFLHDRSQFVKFGPHTSSIGITNAGTPQGTLSGPIDFNVIINDLIFNEECVKYVDDTTVATSNSDPLDNSLQTATNQLISWCPINGMRINEKKTKEMLIYFGHKYPISGIPPVVINDEGIERVSTYKLLGVIFNDRLTWHDHVQYIVSKASKRIFCISQLVKAGINNKDIIVIYCSIVRSILEYCCEVWHPGLSGQQSRDIERVQKRCLKIIYPLISYSEALSLCGLERLDDRRKRRVCDLFSTIKDPGHILHRLLTPRQHLPCVRTASAFQLPKVKSSRARRDFINHCLFSNL